MAQITLRQADEVRLEAKKVREGLFNELVSKNAYIIEELNNRMATAVTKGEMFIEITREELETVPGTEPSTFLSFIESNGFTIIPLRTGSFAAYFYNPEQEKA